VRGGTVVVDFADQSAAACGVGEADAPPDRRTEHRRVVVDEQFGCLASDDRRAPQRFRTKRATSCGRKMRASTMSFSISPDAQPSNGDG
jgi:hypothetical protein